MIDLYIFDVRLGQCVYLYPHEYPEYSMLIDCGHNGDFHPIDLLLDWDLVHLNSRGRYEIGNLTLTNYDNDHFSGLPYLSGKVKLKTINFAKNLTVEEILEFKDEETDALNMMLSIKADYNQRASDYFPPYKKHVFCLELEELYAADITPTTNHLSQMVFIEIGDVVICIPGDLEYASWELMLAKERVAALLERTAV